jgi:DEAD/DEAH box helicase domain-containing protein
VTISILDDTIEDVNGREIDSLGYSRAFFELFEGAIFMHRAKQYLVSALNLSSAVAHTRPVSVNYITSALNKTSINIIKPLENAGIINM